MSKIMLLGEVVYEVIGQIISEVTKKKNKTKNFQAFADLGHVNLGIPLISTMA